MLRYSLLGLFLIGSLALSTLSTHLELAFLTTLLLACLSQGMRRNRTPLS